MNELIRADSIRVIADDGEQLGLMTPADAIERAQSVGLPEDLEGARQIPFAVAGFAA